MVKDGINWISGSLRPTLHRSDFDLLKPKFVNFCTNNQLIEDTQLEYVLCDNEPAHIDWDSENRSYIWTQKGIRFIEAHELSAKLFSWEKLYIKVCQCFDLEVDLKELIDNVYSLGVIKNKQGIGRLLFCKNGSIHLEAALKELKERIGANFFEIVLVNEIEDQYSIDRLRNQSIAIHSLEDMIESGCISDYFVSKRSVKVKNTIKEDLSNYDLVLDDEKSFVTYKGHTFKLTEKKFKLLYRISQQPKEWVHHDELMNVLWSKGKNINNIDTQISCHKRELIEKFISALVHKNHICSEEDVEELFKSEDKQMMLNIDPSMVLL